MIRLPRLAFSLRTLVIFVLLCGSGFGLWYRWEAWVLWHRRRPEWWWGVVWLPEFWATLLFGGGLIWSVRRERRR